MIVNVFLLAICLYVEIGANRITQQAIREAVEYLEKSGTKIDPEMIPTTKWNRSEMMITRAPDTEKGLAETLINGTEISRSGGMLRFASEDGDASAMWRAGGLFEAGFQIAGVYAYEGDPNQNPAVLQLNAAGFHGATVEDMTQQDLKQLTMTQLYNELPVFNAVLTVSCTQEDAVYVAGRWCVGEAQAIGQEQEMELPGLLIRYVEQVRASGTELTSIEKIEAGYYAQTMGNSGVRLIPAWKITGTELSGYISATDATLLLTE